jgi:hypothetical protein
MASDIMLISIAALLGTALVALSVLRGWQGWLQLKTRELETRRPDNDGGVPGGSARIELADLKERIRKLEAIAAGVDL